MSYGVDSLHINIGVGDSAIHLLVRHPEKKGPSSHDEEKPTIVRACLIDGGTSDKTKEIIKKTIDDIKSNYDMPNHGCKDPGYMKFDSVVVTHWDDDHYGGIVQLIKDDLKDQFDKLASGRGVGKPKEWLSGEMGNAKCRYFRYKDDQKKSDHKTTFYAPYWSEKYKKKLKRTQDCPDELKEKDDLLMYEDIFKRTNGGEGKDENVPIAVGELCRLCYDTDVVGTNLFNNKNLPSKNQWGKIKSPAELSVAMKEGTKVKGGRAPVGIYCIASHFNMLGYGDAREQNPRIFLEDKVESKTNQSSICAVVLWSKPKVKVTHYFAGDATFDIEKRAALWVNDTVPNMKLSHHGASTSTPIGMLEDFSPDNIIISAGSMHFHPAWGTLLYLNAWMLKEGKDRQSLFPTRFVIFRCPDPVAISTDNSIGQISSL
jgi:hypothetical protein